MSKSFSSSSGWRKMVGFLLFVSCAAAPAGVSAQKVPATQSKPFNELYQVDWSPHKVRYFRDGTISLTLDKQSGSGFVSTRKYTFGYVSTAIKLVGGDSAGTVTAYYMSSDSSKLNHDELDFEFLGNKSGKPYILQTNVFANGIGGREQRIYLWFDPTTSFHNYSVLWNREIIIFSVDQIPIRVFKNNVKLGVDYPQSKPMGIYSTIWNGEQWATRGGIDKINWTRAPFAASYRTFVIDACDTTTGRSSSCSVPANWWAQSKYERLDSSLQSQLSKVKRNHMIFDYCTDTKRYPVPPPECATN